MYYAQINSGVVCAVTETHSAIDSPDMVTIGSLDASLLGHTYSNGVFTAPAAPADPCANLIDLGPFYDRAAGAKMAILTSTDATVKAIIGDLNIRKWVDLTRPDVASALTYIGSVVPALTPAIQAAMLATPVAAVENLALRKLYF